MPRIQRFRAKPVESCWLWTGVKNGHGYGTLYRNGRHEYAYRLVYEAVKGSIPKGMEIDHLCRVPLCVNPDHLEVVTKRENILRGIGPTAQNARKTHCLKGHPFDAFWSGQRMCKRCHAERKRNFMRKHKLVQGGN